MTICVFLFICSRYLQDRRADPSPNLPGRYGKWAAIEELKFWFLNFFGGGRKVQKGHFRFGSSFTKCKMAAKWISLTKKQPVLILAR